MNQKCWRWQGTYDTGLVEYRRRFGHFPAQAYARVGNPDRSVETDRHVPIGYIDFSIPQGDIERPATAADLLDLQEIEVERG